MRVIRNDGTSYISIAARDSGSEIGVIQKSTAPRTTEIAALSPSIKGNLDHIVTDTRPSLDYFLCNSCGEYVHRRGFTPDRRNRDGIDYVCKSCRAEQRQRHRRAEKEQYLTLMSRKTRACL